MIRLHPLPESAHACPYCSSALEARGWYMPGMRPLARLGCALCGRTYFGDLGAAQALYTPMLLEEETGQVHDTYGVPWFAQWLRSSYAARSAEPLPFTAEEFRPIRRPIILNCFDKLYGHALLKLLNAQHYLDHHPDLDLIVLVPRYLRWMVPNGVAAIWTVDIALRRGTEWNDWLAAEIARRIEPLPECMLSVALPHPHPDDIDVERFTGIPPFPEERWASAPANAVVTFIWREDRLWQPVPEGMRRMAQKLQRKVGLAASRVPEQREKVIELATAIRREIPGLRFVVAGFGEPGGLPEWMEDRRRTSINEATEREWCGLYAESHIVIGVHGSNMLLPSGHAGAVIDLMPEDRWANMLQDLMVRYADPRESMIHCQLVPVSISPEETAAMAVSTLQNRNAMMLNMGRASTIHAGINPGSFAVERLLLK